MISVIYWYWKHDIDESSMYIYMHMINGLNCTCTDPSHVAVTTCVPTV